jgi:hypothetical protein
MCSKVALTWVLVCGINGLVGSQESFLGQEPLHPVPKCGGQVKVAPQLECPVGDACLFGQWLQAWRSTVTEVVGYVRVVVRDQAEQEGDGLPIILRGGIPEGCQQVGGEGRPEWAHNASLSGGGIMGKLGQVPFADAVGPVGEHRAIEDDARVVVQEVGKVGVASFLYEIDCPLDNGIVGNNTFCLACRRQAEGRRDGQESTTYQALCRGKVGLPGTAAKPARGSPYCRVCRTLAKLSHSSFRLVEVILEYGQVLNFAVSELGPG